MKTHLEEISNPLTDTTIKQERTSLPAPPIIQGRAVNTDYSQMPIPTLEACSNEDETGTGYLIVSWEPIEGITKYQVILFNGSIHSYWDVPVDQTSWTTKDKGMFPTEEQFKSGQVNFRRDGRGTEFEVDPSILYKKAFEINGGLNYSDSSEYYVRVAAVYEDGASPISFAETIMIPLDAPILKGLTSTSIVDDSINEINLNWNSVSNAIGYQIWVINDEETYTFDVKNITKYTINTLGLIENLELEKLEAENLVKNMQTESFLVGVSAYNEKNQTSILKNLYSPINNANINQIQIKPLAIVGEGHGTGSAQKNSSVIWKHPRDAKKIGHTITTTKKITRQDLVNLSNYIDEREGARSIQQSVALGVVIAPVNPYLGVAIGLAFSVLTSYVKTNGKIVSDTLKKSTRNSFTIKVTYTYRQVDSNDGYYTIQKIKIT